MACSSVRPHLAGEQGRDVDVDPGQPGVVDGREGHVAPEQAQERPEDRGPGRVEPGGVGAEREARTRRGLTHGRARHGPRSHAEHAGEAEVDRRPRAHLDRGRWVDRGVEDPVDAHGSQAVGDDGRAPDRPAVAGDRPVARGVHRGLQDRRRTTVEQPRQVERHDVGERLHVSARDALGGEVDPDGAHRQQEGAQHQRDQHGDGAPLVTTPPGADRVTHDETSRTEVNSRFWGSTTPIPGNFGPMDPER